MSRAVSFRCRRRGSVRASVLAREIHSRRELRCGLFARVIRRARERTGLHVLESHVHSDLTPASEIFRSNVALNGQAARVRLPVERYVTPEDFTRWSEIGMDMGFKHVQSSPFRSHSSE